MVNWLSQRPTKQKRFVAVLVGLWLAYRLVTWVLATLFERWWLDSVSDAPVWSVRTSATVQLAIVTAIVTGGILLWSNRRAMGVAGRADQQTFRPIAFVRQRLGPALGWLAMAIPLLVAWRFGGSAARHWQQLVLFRSGGSVGETAPEVGFDVGYHLFRLPLLQFIGSTLLVVVAIAVAMAWAIFVLNGALRLPLSGRRSARAAVAHLQRLGALWFVVAAFDLWFVRYPSLASGDSGVFTGAGWAKLNGPGLADRPLAICALVVAAVLIASSLLRVRVRWSIASVGLWLVVALVMIVLFPPVTQRLVVAPAEAQRDLDTIAHNLDATRRVYGLDGVDIDSVESLGDGTGPVDPERLVVFDPDRLAGPLQALQGTTGTRVGDVDLDRYELDGERRPFYIATRNAAVGELPERGWVQRHLVYTHGNGMIATLADETSPAGTLAAAATDEEMALETSELYFGEGLGGWFVITGTRRAELGGAEWRGDSGLDLSSPWRRALAAGGLGDANLLLSSEIVDGSQLLYRRSINERIGAIAPFLALDGDPYPVVADGHIVWVVDAYTTASTYPYSQRAATNGVPGASGLNGRHANYIRHSVVATLDGYSGDVTLYRVDDDDVVLDAWADALPGLLTDAAEMPASVEAHLRYPSDYFTVQTNLLGRYHVESAELLFSGADAWTVAAPPTVPAPGAGAGAAPRRADNDEVWGFASDEPDAAWITMRAFTIGGSRNTASMREEPRAFAVGDHDRRTLSIIAFDPGQHRQAPSPRVAQGLIVADAEFSQLFTLLNANESVVEFGPLTPVFDDGQLVWVRTMIVTGSSAAATPRQNAVIAVVADSVGIGDTVDDAIDAARD